MKIETPLRTQELPSAHLLDKFFEYSLETVQYQHLLKLRIH